MSSDWDGDLKEEDRKDQNEEENQKDSEGKIPQTSPRISLATALLLNLPNPPLNS